MLEELINNFDGTEAEKVRIQKVFDAIDPDVVKAFPSLVELAHKKYAGKSKEEILCSIIHNFMEPMVNNLMGIVFAFDPSFVRNSGVLISVMADHNMYLGAIGDAEAVHRISHENLKTFCPTAKEMERRLEVEEAQSECPPTETKH